MANLNDVLQGLVNINSKIANNINNLLDSIGEGFLDIGTLSVTNDNISLHDAVVLINGENISVPELSTSFVGNKICFLEFDVDKNWILTVLDVVDDNFNYDLSVFKNTSRYFGLAQRFGDIFKDIRVSNSVSNDNTIVGALNGALKAIDYDNEMDLEINMDILSRISAVESDIQDLDIKKADKTYVDEVIANADIDIDIDGVVTAVDVGEIEGVEATYVTRAELDDALSELEVDVDLTEYQKISDNSLTTSNKTIVGAINEVFQRGNNVKEGLVEALIAQGVLASTSESFESLIAKIRSIEGSGSDDSSSLFLLENGALRNTDISGGITTGNSTFSITQAGLVTSSQSSSRYFCFTFNNKIDFSLYNTLEITVKRSSGVTTNTTLYVYQDTYTYNTLGTTSQSIDKERLTGTMTAKPGVFSTITYDISSWGSSDFYLGIEWYGASENVLTISDIKLAKDLSDSSSNQPIITATELPATGKENQICIITDNPVNSFVLASTGSNIPDSTDYFTLHYSNKDSNYACRFGNITQYYHIDSITLNGIKHKAYYWSNSQWNLLTIVYISIVQNGITPGDENSLALALSDKIYYSNGYICMPSDTNYDIISTTTQIDFSKYTKVEIDARTLSSTSKSLTVGISDHMITGDAKSYELNYHCLATTPSQNITSTLSTYSFDLSTFKDVGYLVIGAGRASVVLSIVNVRLYV